jgi:hypothetical protein
MSFSTWKMKKGQQTRPQPCEQNTVGNQNNINGQAFLRDIDRNYDSRGVPPHKHNTNTEHVMETKKQK